MGQDSYRVPTLQSSSQSKRLGPLQTGEYDSAGSRAAACGRRFSGYLTKRRERNTFRTLEFETIRALLLSHAGSAAGRSRVRALPPATTPPEPSARPLARTTEGVRLLRALGRQPYHDLPDVRSSCPRRAVEGLHLEPLALLDVASFIEGAVEIARAWRASRARPGSSAAASDVPD